ncbi:GNAT family N-acetyltransferase [Rhodovulum sp. DZ06]|uniref:GNAT family N-acetyltransferase n=1 Tax=Rhodovulum sp. DZ06 TaxID=3425126 RepID=UPI003D32EAC5
MGCDARSPSSFGGNAHPHPGAAEVTARRPSPDDPLGREAAAALARSRLSVRARLPDDENWPPLFARLRPGAGWAATGPEGTLLGALAVGRGGADAWDLSRAAFAAAYGPLAGPLRLARHRAAERLAAGPACHLSAFWVAPQARGRGIGGLLLDALCAAEPGPITLLARPGREAFYRRHGFREGGPARLRLVGRLARMTAMERPAPIPARGA